MFNGHGSAHNGSNGLIEETRLEKRTTPCTFVDIEAEKVTAVEEVTEHGAVHSSTAAAVEKEGVKTVEKIGTHESDGSIHISITKDAAIANGYLP